MATTKITSNVLAPNAAQNNINSDASFFVSIPTQFTNTLTCNSSVTIAGNLTVNTNTLFVDSVNGRVGISTITPSKKLEILSSQGNGIRINNGSATFDFSIYTDNTLRILQSAGYGCIVDATGHLTIGNTVGTGSRDLFVRRIINTPDASGTGLSINGTASQSGNYISVTSNGGSAGEVFNIKSSGNVGIGTTTPTEKLTVVGNIIASNNITASNNIIGYGTDNRLYNQIANQPESIITSKILKNIDYAAISTLTTPSSSVAYLPLGSPRLDSNVTQTWGTNNVPAYMLPFLITKSFQKITINHVSGTHPTALLQIAIYSADSNGKPTTLVETGTVELSSTGVKTLTLTQQISINGLFYIAIRPTIGNTNWISSGGSGTLTIRGAAVGHFPQFSQIIGGVNPTTMQDFGGTLLYRWISYTASFPSDLTSSIDVGLHIISNGPIWLCAVHN